MGIQNAETATLQFYPTIKQTLDQRPGMKHKQQRKIDTSDEDCACFPFNTKFTSVA